jgi:hypothetical protein
MVDCHLARLGHDPTVVTAPKSTEAITTWLLFHLPMSFATRVGCNLSSIEERVRTLAAILRAA